MGAVRSYARKRPRLRLMDFGNYALRKSGATLADFSSVSYSFWLKIEGNTDHDATIFQWTMQDYPSAAVYRQALRVRWWRTVGGFDNRLTCEIWDKTIDGGTGEEFGLVVTNSGFELLRGRLAHVFGVWDRTYGLKVWVDGTLTVDRAATWPYAIPCEEVDWLAIGGGQNLASDGSQLNKLEGWLGGLWVGFNQVRAVTDFRTLEGLPAVMPEQGNFGDGRPEVYFPMNGPFDWYEARNQGTVTGLSRDPNHSLPREVQL